MKTSLLPAVFAGLLVLPPVISPRAHADANLEEFQTIVERNVFGLREPPAPAPTNAVEETKPSNVKLTGFTTILSPPRALIMVQEQGKMSSFVLREGQREGPILVKSINVEKGEVRIANGPMEELLTFETHGVKPAMAPPVATAAANPQNPVILPGGRPTPGNIPRPVPTRTNYGAAVQRSRASAESPYTRNLPVRNVRIPSQNLNQQPQGSDASPMSGDEAISLYLINKTIAQPQIDSGVLPPLPPVPGVEPVPTPPGPDDEG